MRRSYRYQSALRDDRWNGAFLDLSGFAVTQLL